MKNKLKQPETLDKLYGVISAKTGAWGTSRFFGTRLAAQGFLNSRAMLGLRHTYYIVELPVVGSAAIGNHEVWTDWAISPENRHGIALIEDV